MFSSFKHRFKIVVSFKTLTNKTIPKSIRVIVEIYGQISASFFPLFMYFWWFWKLHILVLTG